MDRRSFLAKLGIGTAAVITTKSLDLEPVQAEPTVPPAFEPIKVETAVGNGENAGPNPFLGREPIPAPPGWEAPQPLMAISPTVAALSRLDNLTPGDLAYVLEDKRVFMFDGFAWVAVDDPRNS